MTYTAIAINAEADIEAVFKASDRAGKAQDVLKAALTRVNRFRDLDDLDPALSEAIHKTVKAYVAAREAADALHAAADGADCRLADAKLQIARAAASKTEV